MPAFKESQMNNPNFACKNLEKEEPPQLLEQKKITKMRVKINEIETKMTFHQTYIAGSNILVYL